MEDEPLKGDTDSIRATRKKCEIGERGYTPLFFSEERLFATLVLFLFVF